MLSAFWSLLPLIKLYTINLFHILLFSLSELKAEYNTKKIKISSDLFAKGCVTSPEQGLQAAQKIGFPVMIKASEGGGGKGIRKVENPDDFHNMFRQVSVAINIKIIKNDFTLTKGCFIDN